MTPLFRPAPYEARGARVQRGWRIILPVWIPRYERFYDIWRDEFRYGVRVDTIALSFTRDTHGARFGLDWGPVELGEWTPRSATKPVPWMAA